MTLAHSTAAELRAMLDADLLTRDDVIAILRARAVKGPSRRLLEELTGEKVTPSERPAAPVATRDPVADDPCAYLLTIATDGKARTDEWTYTRWALCHSSDGVEPAHRYRNGGPVNVARPVAGKDAPLWMHRAVAFVRSMGPMTRAELANVAAWFQANRTGTPVADFAMAAK